MHMWIISTVIWSTRIAMHHPALRVRDLKTMIWAHIEYVYEQPHSHDVRAFQKLRLAKTPER